MEVTTCYKVFHGTAARWAVSMSTVYAIAEIAEVAGKQGPTEVSCNPQAAGWQYVYPVHERAPSEAMEEWLSLQNRRGYVPAS